MGKKKAKTWICLLCETENSISQDICEVCDTPRSISEDITYAATGDIPSMLRLGRAYFNGEGVPKDIEKALRYYGEASKRGDPSASVSLGEMFFNGNGVKQDYRIAYNYFQSAADKGVTLAQYYIGVCHEYGFGTWKDVDLAIQWYRKAAEQGNKLAIQRLKIIRMRRLKEGFMKILRKLLLILCALGVMGLIIFGIIISVEEDNRKEREAELAELNKIYGDESAGKVLLDSILGDMVFVEGGQFEMGASGTETQSQPAHTVTVSSFFLCKHEVTQLEWTTLMGENPSEFKGKKRPVEKVTWHDCRRFIRKLNHLTGLHYRLPTEAEWEYAARGGRKSNNFNYSGSNNVGDVAWYKGNSDGQSHDVMTKFPNELGLFDMNGNVSELCNDYYGPYSVLTQTDPKGPESGSGNVVRGSSWYSSYPTMTWRDELKSGYYASDKGFRLVLSTKSE